MSNGLDRSDALEILKLALDDIDRIKQQQWRDFYAVLVAQGGLLVLVKDYPDSRLIFVLLSLFAGVLGGWLIGLTQRKLEQKFRARKNRALHILGPYFNIVWDGRDKPDELERSNFYPTACLVVLGVGTAVAILVMLKYPPAYL